MRATHDILIVGSGLTGLSVYRALQHLPIRIGLMSSSSSSPTDNRSIALSRRSQQIFEKQQIWTTIKPFATPIQNVHVSDQGHLGITRFTAAEAHVPALGHVVPLSSLINALHIPTLHAVVDSMTPLKKGWALNTSNGTFSAPLIIAADGAQSTIRQWQHISIIQESVAHVAMVTRVMTKQAHDFTAYERFTRTGAIALLPVAPRTYSLIWTVPLEEKNHYLELGDKEFLSLLQQQFGYRLGRFIEVMPRQAHRLNQFYAKEQIKPGLVLMGNAAHTLTPIAAQGFNLGLRDIDCLATLIEQHGIEDERLLEKYLALRLPDQKNLMYMTQMLMPIFSAKSLSTRIFRNVGLLALDLISPLKQISCQYGMGIR